MGLRFGLPEHDFMSASADESAAQFGVGDQFAERGLAVRGFGAADSFGEMAGEASKEAQFDHPADGALKHRIAGAARHQAIENLDVAVDENAFPRDGNFVEDGERVLLVKTRTERAIEFAAAGIVSLAADELEAGSIHRDGEAERVGLFAGAARIEWSDPQFVGKGC